jgi:4-alpha-glucanotransferase
MRETGFEFIRSRVRHAHGLYDTLRIDHVVGLFRTFGYPLEAETTGAFDPADESAQLAQGEEILKLISEEAGSTAIIAEDLGVIPPSVREILKGLAIPGYKVMRWEKEMWNTPQERFIDPAKYPEVSLATTGTHDTDTLVEWWREAPEAERQGLAQVLKLEDSANEAPLSERTRDRILESLYDSPSRYVIIPIQDLFGWSDRINVPGTIDDANWRWRLPFELDRGLADAKIRAQSEKIRALVDHSGRLVALSK